MIEDPEPREQLQGESPVNQISKPQAYQSFETKIFNYVAAQIKRRWNATKSYAEKKWNTTQSTREATSIFTRLYYGAATAPLRVPTIIRKLRNDQSVISTIGEEFGINNRKATDLEGYSSLLGGVLGLATDAALLGLAISEFKKGNSNPLIIGLATTAAINIYSGCYEAITAPKIPQGESQGPDEGLEERL